MNRAIGQFFVYLVLGPASVALVAICAYVATRSELLWRKAELLPSLLASGFTISYLLFCIPAAVTGLVMIVLSSFVSAPLVRLFLAAAVGGLATVVYLGLTPPDDRSIDWLWSLVLGGGAVCGFVSCALIETFSFVSSVRARRRAAGSLPGVDEQAA